LAHCFDFGVPAEQRALASGGRMLVIDQLALPAAVDLLFSLQPPLPPP